MASEKRWQQLLADIIELTGAIEGDIVVEIKRLPHKMWETIDAREHEFPDQPDHYLKEYKPIVNLTVKAFCRCVTHKNLVSESYVSPLEDEPKPMTEQERKALAKFFDEDSFGFK